MGIGEPAVFLVNVNGVAATVSDDRGGFSCFSGSRPTENHKNIYFLIFFWENIWWYIKFDIFLHRQTETTTTKKQDYDNDYRAFEREQGDGY